MSFAEVIERLRTRENPYPGLRPFEMEESHLFFGRDQQVAELVGRLERNRFLVVLGVSGSGKSSLVRAGLLPALERGRALEAGRSWRVIVMRPAGAPFSTLAKAIEEVGLDASRLAQSSHGLIDVARQLPQDQGLLVVVDQFEELFRYKDLHAVTEQARRRREALAAEAVEFVQLVLAASRHQPPVYVVLTMRSDYLGDCAEFRDLPETLNDCQYLVPRMTREQRKEAIEGPLGRVEIAPSLVQRLLNDAGDEPDQLPVLQHALMRTWDRWHRDDPEARRRIDLPDYLAIGGFRKAIDQHAEETLAGSTEPIAEAIFKRLTARGRGNRERRDPAKVSDLQAICGADTAEARNQVTAFIDRFRLGAATFLTPRAGAIGPETYIDITHESLIRQWRRLREVWLPAEQRSAKALIDLAEKARNWSAGKAEPLVGLDLNDALEWDRQRNKAPAWAEHYAEPEDLGRVTRLIEASRKRDRAQRLRSRSLWVTAPLAAVFLVLLIVALKQTVEANRLGRLSLARQLAARSQLALAEQGELEPSVLLAVEALRRFPSADAERALRQAVALLPRQIAALPVEGLVRLVSVSSDGHSVAAVSEDNTVRVFETSTWRQFATMKSGSLVHVLLFNERTGWLIATPDAGAVLLRAVSNGSEIRRFSTRTPARLVTASRNGRYLATVNGETATVFDVLDGRATPLQRPITDVEMAAVSSDGRWVALSTNEKATDYRVRVFELATGTEHLNVRHLGAVRALAFSADGRWLATGSDEGTARVFDAESGTEASRAIHRKPVRSVAFSHDARAIVTGSEDGAARVFDTATGLEMSRFRGHCGSRAVCTVAAVGFGGDGRWIISGADTGSVLVSDAGGANQLARFGDEYPVTSTTFAADGQRLMTGSGHIEAALVRVFDAPSWQEVVRIQPSKPEIRALAVSGDGRSIFVASNWAGGPWTYRVEEPEKPDAGFGGLALMESVTVSDDGRWVATVASGVLQVFDALTRNVLPLPSPKAVRRVALSRDGRWIAVGTGEHDASTVQVFELPGGTASWQFEQDQRVEELALSADGRWLATASGTPGSRIRLVDKDTKQMVWSVQNSPSSLLTFSPDGRTLITPDADDVLRVFDTTTGTEVTRLFPGRRVRALGFAEQGRYLMATSQATSIYSTSDVIVTRYLLRQADVIADACSRVARNLLPKEWTDYVGTEVPNLETCGKR